MTKFIGDRTDAKLRQKIQFMNPKVDLPMREARREPFNFPVAFDTAYDDDAYIRLNASAGHLRPIHRIGNTVLKRKGWARGLRFQFVEQQDPAIQHIPLSKLQEYVRTGAWQRSKNLKLSR